MDTTAAFDFLDEDPDAQRRVAALLLAADVFNRDVPRPQIKRSDFGHELTGMATYILDGTDLFNDTEED